MAREETKQAVAAIKELVARAHDSAITTSDNDTIERQKTILINIIEKFVECSNVPSSEAMKAFSFVTGLFRTIEEEQKEQILQAIQEHSDGKSVTPTLIHDIRAIVQYTMLLEDQLEETRQFLLTC